MSTKPAFVATLVGVLLANSMAAGAITQSIAKVTKKHDNKPPLVTTVDSQRAEEHNKKDSEKKQNLTAANGRTGERKNNDGQKQQLVAADAIHQPALMKPASLRHFQQQHHRHHRFTKA